LVITGVTAYTSGIASTIEEWLSETFTDESGTLFVKFRTPRNNADAFVFTLRDWAAMQRVLSAKEEFKNFFGGTMLSDLSAPMLLYQYNSFGSYRRNLPVEIESGGNKLSSQMKAIETNLNRRMDVGPDMGEPGRYPGWTCRFGPHLAGDHTRAGQPSTGTGAWVECGYPQVHPDQN
jgi:hypothetical protein